jgi:hypothetical protein
MRKIVVNENISLDGVVEDPTGEERVRHGGWFDQYLDKDREAWAEVEFAGAGCRGPALGSNRLNSLPKYVVSSGLVDPAWDNSMVLKGDVLAIQRSLVWSPPS